jgi:GAF domain-containing protein
MISILLVLLILQIPTIMAAVKLRAKERRQRSDIDRMQSMVDGNVMAKITTPKRMEVVEEAEQYMDDPRLVHLTRVVASVVKAPLVLVTLVKNDKQCFLAITDEGDRLEGDKSTPIRDSFCRYVVATKNPFEVNEALMDPLVRNSSVVQEKGVRSYLGVPIEHDGEVLGALCALDFQPREWTEREYQQLFEFAALIDNILEVPA